MQSKLNFFVFKNSEPYPPQTHNENARLQTTPNKQTNPKQTSYGFSKKCSYGTRRGAEGEGGRKKYLG